MIVAVIAAVEISAALDGVAATEAAVAAGRALAWVAAAVRELAVVHGREALQTSALPAQARVRHVVATGAEGF
jgi:hypothetical protein